TRDQLERERHANEEVLRQVEEARTCLETEKLQFRDQEATLFRERSVQDRPSYKWNKELWNSNKGRLGRRTMPVAARSRVHAAFHSDVLEAARATLNVMASAELDRVLAVELAEARCVDELAQALEAMALCEHESDDMIAAKRK
ncbi:hypothetical protein DYB30_013851, partial [Aphanomyces astaci]